jgi:phospho-N-acetylmuramoyl-pentapeptide-transferase
VRLIIIAGVFSMIFSLFATPLLIKALRSRGRAQAIRVSDGDIKYPEHNSKVGTPSMGGLAILGGTIVGYSMAHLMLWRPPTLSALLAIGLMIGLAIVGFADDYLKIYKQNSRGIRARTKLLGQALVAFIFGYATINYPDELGRTPGSTSLSFVRDTNFVLPTVVFILLVWFLVTAATNAVNLTDGLDGLAAGAAVLTLGAYILIGVFEFGQNWMQANVNLRKRGVHGIASLTVVFVIPFKPNRETLEIYNDARESSRLVLMLNVRDFKEIVCRADLRVKASKWFPSPDALLDLRG